MADLSRTVLQLVWGWIGTVQRLDHAKAERQLDRAVDDTFPASDPIASGAMEDRVEHTHRLVCTVERGQMVLCWQREAAAATALTERYAYGHAQGETPDGSRLDLEIRIDRDLLDRFSAENGELLPLGGWESALREGDTPPPAPDQAAAARPVSGWRRLFGGDASRH